MRGLLVRFIFEEYGQDLIEYGLLGAGIATVGILAWDAIRTELGDKYEGWDTAVQDAWEPPPPVTP